MGELLLFSVLLARGDSWISTEVFPRCWHGARGGKEKQQFSDHRSVFRTEAETPKLDPSLFLNQSLEFSICFSRHFCKGPPNPLGFFFFRYLALV